MARGSVESPSLHPARKRAAADRASTGRMRIRWASWPLLILRLREHGCNGWFRGCEQPEVQARNHTPRLTIGRRLSTRLSTCPTEQQSRNQTTGSKTLRNLFASPGRPIDNRPQVVNLPHMRKGAGSYPATNV